MNTKKAKKTEVPVTSREIQAQRLWDEFWRETNHMPKDSEQFKKELRRFARFDESERFGLPSIISDTQLREFQELIGKHHFPADLALSADALLDLCLIHCKKTAYAEYFADSIDLLHSPVPSFRELDRVPRGTPNDDTRALWGGRACILDATKYMIVSINTLVKARGKAVRISLRVAELNKKLGRTKAVK